MSRPGGPDSDDVDAMLPSAPRRQSRPDVESQIKQSAQMKQHPPSDEGAMKRQRTMPSSRRLGSESKVTRPAYRLSIQQTAYGPGERALSSSQRSTPTTEAGLTSTSAPRPLPPPDMASHASQATMGGAISALTEDPHSPIVATVVRGTQQENEVGKTKKIPFYTLLTDRRILALLTVCLAIIIGLIIGLVLTLVDQGSTPSVQGSVLGGQPDTVTPRSPAPSGTPTSSPSSFAPTWTNQQAMDLMMSRGFPVTPVSQNAMMWVHDDPSLLSFTDDRILQRYALASFYFEIQANGPPFLWETDIAIENECEWSGIMCHDNGAVFDLDAHEIGLQGTLPVQLSLLTNLEFLVVWGNQFRGEFPVEYLAWEKIKGIYISGNAYTGTIPSTLYLMTNLEYLNVEWNQWDAGPFPRELLNFPRLQGFDFTATQRTGTIPEEIYDLPYLGGFAIARNRMTGTLSTKIGRLSSLWTLNLGTNFFEGGIPTEIGLCTNNLGFIDLYENDFTGTIPTELALCTKLFTLDLSTNHLTGTFPEELTYLTNIKGWFGLARNQLNGTISTGIGRFRQLDNVLELENNQFTGTIPSELGLLTNMTTALKLHSNLLTGTLPTELGNLDMIAELSVQHNSAVNGTIPVQFGKMIALTLLQLHDTAVTGSVPSEVCLLNTDRVLETISRDCDVGCACCGNFNCF